MGILVRAQSPTPELTEKKAVACMLEEDDACIQPSQRDKNISTTRHHAPAPYSEIHLRRNLNLLGGMFSLLETLVHYALCILIWPESTSFLTLVLILVWTWFDMAIVARSSVRTAFIVFHVPSVLAWLYYNGLYSEWKFEVLHILKQVVYTVITPCVTPIIILVMVIALYYAGAWLTRKTHQMSHRVLHHAMGSFPTGRLLTRPWSPIIDTIQFRKCINVLPPVLHDIVRDYIESPRVLDFYRDNYGDYIPSALYIDATQGASFQRKVSDGASARAGRFAAMSPADFFAYLPWRMGCSEPVLRIPIVHPSYSCRYNRSMHKQQLWKGYLIFEVDIDDNDVARKNLKVLMDLQTNVYYNKDKQEYSMLNIGGLLINQPMIVGDRKGKCGDIAINANGAYVSSFKSPIGVRRWDDSSPANKKKLFQMRIGSDAACLDELKRWIASDVVDNNECDNKDDSDHKDDHKGDQDADVDTDESKHDNGVHQATTDGSKPHIRWVHVRLGVLPWKSGAVPSDIMTFHVPAFTLVLDLVHIE